MGYHFLMLTLAASVCARLPATDLVVPEKLDFAAHTTADSFIQAMTKSGGTEADCRSFATTTIASIKAEVTSEQGILNAVDTGSGCAQEGQTLVSSTQVTLTAAQADLVAKQDTAASALSTKNTACSASVAFAVNLDTLQAKTCYDYTSEATYISAMTECGSATTALTKADQAVNTATTAVSDAQKAYDAAVAEAARLKSACHCRVQREQATAWTAASAATAAHAADCKQAHEVICALNQATTCPVPTCQTVTQPTAANGVDAEDCSQDVSSVAPTTYYQGKAGTICPPGQRITSKDECLDTALNSLDLQNVRNWVGSTAAIPVGCSIRNKDVRNKDLRPHWNGSPSGVGRSDLNPVCKAAM